MANSISFPLDDGNAHPTGDRPAVWCDYGGTDIYAHGVNFQPFPGGGTGIGHVQYVQTVAPAGRTIKSMCPNGPSGTGVHVLLDDCSDVSLSFNTGVVIVL